MLFSLDNFESHTANKVLQRGIAYYQNRQVGIPERIDEDIWAFNVAGSSNYLVRVELEGKDVVEYSCNCPYEGVLCKHVVASFLVLRDVLEGASPLPQNLADQTDDIIRQINPENLQDFVKEAVLHDQSFRQLFYSRFGHLSGDTSQDFFARQIRAVVESMSDRYGYIDYERVFDLSQPVMQTLENAEKMLQEAQPGVAANIAKAVLEEMLQAMMNADDSSGTIGDLISEAIGFLGAIAEHTNDEAVRKDIFQYALAACQNKEFSDYGFDTDFLEMTAHLAREQDERQRVYQLLDQQRDSHYRAESMARIRLQLMQQSGDEQAAAEAYIWNNRHLPGFRRQLIKEAFEQQQYPRVKELVQEGMEHDEDYAGLTREWQEWLLKTAQAESDRKEIIRLAQHLFLHYGHDMQYYEMLKKEVSNKEWQPFLKSLLRNLERESRWIPYHTLGEIYIREERWKDLLQVVQKHKSLSVIEQYQPYLQQHFPKELLDMYEEKISEHFDRASGRSDYSSGCYYLQQMSRAGGKERVQALIRELRLAYPRRPALQDELDKLEKQLG
ncbi:MAG: SWIM zinc finger domain-containing protein [Cyclobacteriaceae bacterium]